VSAEDVFDLSAAGLRADGTDLRISLQVLAAKLEGALPQQTRVERSGGGLFGRGEKQVRSVQVTLGECCYALGLDGGRLAGSRERRVGGISIKREALAPAEWVSALTEDLRSESEQSQAAGQALKELLG
jgi:hypothetical protein